MKKKYLFCTKIWFYLTEIPLLILLIISCLNSSRVEVSFGLIPLIIVIALVMIFIFLYYFRLLILSYEEVRTFGLFAPRDSALINKDKTLIITMKPHSNLHVAVYGNDGTPPMFDGLKDQPPIDIYLFRGKAIGGRHTVASLLNYFGIPRSDASSAMDEDTFSGDYRLVSLYAEKKEDIREISIKFKETL